MIAIVVAVVVVVLVIRSRRRKARRAVAADALSMALTRGVHDRIPYGHGRRPKDWL